MRFVMPPLGFAGAAQQTMANQHLHSKSLAKISGGRRRRKKKSSAVKSTRKRRATKARKGGRARLVKGSAAAKRYMAKIRKLRKR
jgi:hypothetical protein